MATKVHPIVQQVVARLHVSASYIAAVRAVKNAMKRGAWKALPCRRRRSLIKQAIVAHARNRDVYEFVMGGRAW